MEEYGVGIALGEGPSGDSGIGGGEGAEPNGSRK